MEVEIKEYIRTKEGIIGIFQNIDEHCRYYGERLEDTIYIINTEKNEYLRLTDNDIKTHSKNIIDLIEVGDIVNKEMITIIRRNDKTIESDTCYFTEKDIKTILTHEQYEQNCYKLKE